MFCALLSFPLGVWGGTLNLIVQSLFLLFYCNISPYCYGVHCILSLITRVTVAKPAPYDATVKPMDYSGKI